MSKLKFQLTKNEFIAQKTSPEEIFFVIKLESDRVLLRKESDDSLISLPNRTVNLLYIKVKPETIKVLYAKNDNSGSADSDCGNGKE